MEKLKVGVVIFFVICSVIWAQDIKPVPQAVPLCEITIMPVESLANICPYNITIISPTPIYTEPNESTPIIYQAKSGQTFPVFEKKDDWYKVSKDIGWVLKTNVKETRIPPDSMKIKHIGRILYATDSFVLFWKSGKSYDITKLNELTKNCPIRKLKKFVRPEQEMNYGD